ncbi:hypothetical protein PPTG_07686 [Phytophthora nicotianae INRA-310]|uniref:Amino acid transporter transmembrane domain-containing protein n=1 Tax=Phytophthora nicotianae (strain INRA-310) TaxID=761204 RepID=W2QQ98_PHYN3|nr:hypothetical protein PPTG_07686 [Phytophthora nicotianae INRA-310]ETN14694.1 hypothetical protein PPTG_07686 [Phytophthora nicotianae INRA-310]
MTQVQSELKEHGLKTAMWDLIFIIGRFTVILHIVIIVVLVIFAIVFKDHFTEFADFVGASCITMNCILLPTVFYLVKAWDRIAIYEKVAAGIVLVACSFLGCYVTYTAGKALFSPTENDAQFPYCHADFENTINYNYSLVYHGNNPSSTCMTRSLTLQ